MKPWRFTSLASRAGLLGPGVREGPERRPLVCQFRCASVIRLESHGSYVKVIVMLVV